jgi:heme-degrading monooxygenase HmoA
VILTEWDSVEDGHKFLQSEELKEAGRESGVIEMFGTYDTSKSLKEVEKKSV